MTNKNKLIENINNIIKIFNDYKSDIVRLRDKLSELSEIKEQVGLQLVA